MLDPNGLLRTGLLALCVWREARGEPLYGKMLVAQVIENRSKDARWPSSLVEVVLQPLQFSAFNKSDPNSTLFPREGDQAWAECVAAAEFVQNTVTPLTRANHYLVKTLTPKPKWYRADKVVATVGNHSFLEL